MAINWRRGAVFVAGLALGVAGTLVLFAPEGGDAQRPTSAASAPAASVPLPVVASAPRCETYSPIVAPRGEGDGELAMDKDVPASGSAVHNAIVQGKEAAASGKLRDAETAFLMACRSAEKLQDDPVALADAQYQLGRHYAQAAASANAARRDEFMERAQALYATALAAYREHRGPDHEKTRFAAEGLAQLQQRMAGAGAAPPSGQEAAAKEAAAKEAAAKEAAAKEAAAKEAAAKEAAVKEAAAKEAAAKEAAAKEAAAKEAAAKEAAAKEAAAKEAAAQDETAAPARPERETRVAAAEPEPRRAASTRRTNPSFDCALARSTTERLICADEDLARQDRELGRLHQRAKEAAPDPRAFQRRSDAAWQRREDECRDRACLQRWYAQRRAELLSSLDTRASARSAPPPQPPAVIAPPPAPPSSPAVVAGTASGDAGVGGAIPQAEGSTGAD